MPPGFDRASRTSADSSDARNCLAASRLTAGAAGMRFSLPNSSIMVHQPSGGYQGQVTDILIHAKEVEALKRRLNEIYVKHTGRSYDEIESALERDNFMTSDVAKEFGLIDRVIESALQQIEIEVEFVGADERTDLAVLRAKTADLPSLVLGDSADLMIGEWVIALALGGPTPEKIPAFPTLVKWSSVSRKRRTMSSTRVRLTWCLSARSQAAWITGPSAMGSENGTPSSSRSAPASTSACISGTVTSGCGSPAVM